MAIPDGVTMVTVTHTMTDVAGESPLSTTVEVRPRARIWVPGEQASFLPNYVPVSIDSDGTYTFEVPAVDDPSLVGADVTYMVSEYSLSVGPGKPPGIRVSHRIAPTLADAPGPVGLFDTLVTAPVPGGAGKFVDQIVDRAVDEAVDQITDDLGDVFAPAVHDHPATDISDSSALGRTLMAVADTGAGRDALGITVDTSAGTRVMVGGVTVHYDTGWRQLPNPPRMPTGRILVRRTLETATLRLEGVEITDTSNRTVAEYISDQQFIPSGFRPKLYGDRPNKTFIGDYNSYGGVLGIAQQSRMIYLRSTGNPLGMGNGRASGELRYTPTDALPTSLPGVPA